MKIDPFMIYFIPGDATQYDYQPIKDVISKYLTILLSGYCII